ncbi:hypothetical protein EZS27_025012 [termite gut metagenome]|uniref:DUF5020 domain-containing protein n=1 Tax=termite gut metagenome TaxID=433724 RepID=A0A5J4QYL2_9ZZZZ
MKKTIATFLFLFSMFIATVNAQNIQLHYDFGSALYNEYDGRPLVTSTVEKFQPDKWGSTFFFIDMDYTSKGIVSAYWEIARELQFWKGPFSAHVEYNGGLAGAYSFNNAWLAGATYTYNNPTYTKGFTLSAMYKYIQKLNAPNNAQLTGTWYVNFLNKLYTFSGFADVWTEGNISDNIIFLSEPQFWVNLNALKNVSDDFNLSLGTEVELNYNFGGHDGFHTIPTLAMKWTF